MTIKDIQTYLQIYLCSSKSPSNTAYEKILKDKDTNNLHEKFNNFYPFTYHNFKRRDVRDVWIPISKSVTKYYEK